jgi:hypothetical protein
MSRQLPARPSLEHLRKQAKDLLDVWQQGNPTARLADAQHALAVEYGFASWPRLKAHVERRQSEARAARPLAGRWVADAARSRPHPDNPWRTATIVFDVAGDTVRIADRVVDTSGREARHVSTIQADGIEHGSDTGHGYSLLARWRDDRTLETIGRKDGAVVGTATYAVSDDGSTLTITAERQRVVLYRSDDAVV